MHEGGGNCLKYLKKGWSRKGGRGNKDFKKGKRAGSRGGCLEKGAGTPLRTMILKWLTPSDENYLFSFLWRMRYTT